MLISTILWRRLDLPGHDVCRLLSTQSGWTLRGASLFLFDGKPTSLNYAVDCDRDWQTLGGKVEGHIGDVSIDLVIACDAARRWTLNGARCPAVDGCIDLDLNFSPSTNLLPIRRLGLAHGAEAEVRAAWLTFPGLAFEPLVQTYRREAEAAYTYTSAGGAFRATLEIDDAGFVTRYPGGWEQEAANNP